MPGSQKIIMTASAHHSNLGGSLVLLDRSRGTEEDGADRAAHARGALPRDEKPTSNMYYANPYPLAEEHYLVAWSDRHLPPHCRVDNDRAEPGQSPAACISTTPSAT